MTRAIVELILHREVDDRTSRAASSSLLKRISLCKPCYSQRLSTLFPVIGEFVVVLGFTSCGSYLCVSNTFSIHFYDLVLSKDQIYPRFINKTLLHLQDLSLDHCYIELLTFANASDFSCTITCPRYLVDEQLDIGSFFYSSPPDCILRIFRGSQILLKGNFPTVLGRTKWFQLTNSSDTDFQDPFVSNVITATTTVVLNTVDSLICLLVQSNAMNPIGDEVSSPPTRRKQTATGNVELSEAAPVAVTPVGTYHLLSNVTDVYPSLDDRLTHSLQLSPDVVGYRTYCISGVALSKQLMATYFPKNLLLDFEIRFVGPDPHDDDGLLVALSVQYQEALTGRMDMHIFLLCCKPSKDFVGIVRFCELYFILILVLCVGLNVLIMFFCLI